MQAETAIAYWSSKCKFASATVICNVRLPACHELNLLQQIQVLRKLGFAPAPTHALHNAVYIDIKITAVQSQKVAVVYGCKHVRLPSAHRQVTAERRVSKRQRMQRSGLLENAVKLKLWIARLQACLSDTKAVHWYSTKRTMRCLNSPTSARTCTPLRPRIKAQR